ncbi:MAG: hypothetical protein CMP23_11380 [Rickettsiales bacterium]|nr:hypothetical protein [Rickettsiales bacterium]
MSPAPESGAGELRSWVLVVGALGLLLAVVGSLFLPSIHSSGPELEAKSALSREALRTLGCAWLMAWWWIGSRLPLAVPSLIPLALFPLLGILDSKAAARPYADRMVLLLLCGFLLALAVEKWSLHRRVALAVLVRFGRSPALLVATVMGISALLSMWISNTATTLMMLPIVMALVASASDENPDARVNGRFGQLLMLALAYSASIGGMATPVGTPPNLIFASVYADQFPSAAEIDFASWMQIGVPVSALMLAVCWLLLTRLLLPLPSDYRLGDRQVLRARLRALGSMNSAERRVAVGFLLTCLLWVFRTKLGLPAAVHDSTIAAAMVIVFFLAPSGAPAGKAPRLLEWSDSRQLPWGLLLLFGGGIALSSAFKASGLTAWLATQLEFLTALPAVLMIAGICLVVTLLTELTSNTATTALILPVLAATAASTGVDPLLLMVPATLAASCAFMLPVATAPNAIVVGSGAVDTASMVRCGLVLNLSGVIPITWMVLLLVG